MSISRQFQTQYQQLNVNDDEGYEVESEREEGPPIDNIVVQPSFGQENQSRWNHLQDLDEFFTRIYHYVHRNGFWPMVLQDLLQVIVLWYVVTFPTFIYTGVDYQVLFQDRLNLTYKVLLSDAILPWDRARKNFNPLLVIILLITGIYLVFRSFKSLYNLLKYWEMRIFFTSALKIEPGDLANKTWHEVQSTLIAAQRQLHMCVHKSELTELDVYHRILRFKNYMVSMVNKSVLPMKFHLPLIGELVLFTSGLKYNYELILFWGPGAPFENNWQLRNEYKSSTRRQELIATMSRRILIIGLVNLLLSPVIFVWTVLYFFFENFALFRNDPSMLGSRKWSLYGRHFLRHFNELDHEFVSRLNRGYRPAEKYMNLFSSPIMKSLAHFTIVICSGFLAFLILCTIRDEDTLSVQGIIGIMTVLGLIVTLARTFIPDENLVRMPETLMTAVLCQIHYMDDRWKGKAHTEAVRKEFSHLFQYKMVYLVEEMASAILTPFILLFRLRQQSSDIVDFFRNFTVSIEGVGDICSFAQMDLRKHGNPDWTSLADPELTKPENKYQRAEYGKTELSLIHFKLTNPEWKAPNLENNFVNTLRHNVQVAKKDMGFVSLNPTDNPLTTSSQAFSLMGQPEFCSMMASNNYFPPQAYLSRTEYDSMITDSVTLQQQQLQQLQQLHSSRFRGDGSRLLLAPEVLEDASERKEGSDGATLFRSNDVAGQFGYGTSSVSSPEEKLNYPVRVKTWREYSDARAGSSAHFGTHAASGFRNIDSSDCWSGRSMIINEGRLEQLANEMSYSALYLYQNHHNQHHTTTTSPQPLNSPPFSVNSNQLQQQLQLASNNHPSINNSNQQQQLQLASNNHPSINNSSCSNQQQQLLLSNNLPPKKNHPFDDYVSNNKRANKFSLTNQLMTTTMATNNRFQTFDNSNPQQQQQPRPFDPHQQQQQLLDFQQLHKKQKQLLLLQNQQLFMAQQPLEGYRDGVDNNKAYKNFQDVIEGGEDNRENPDSETDLFVSITSDNASIAAAAVVYNNHNNKVAASSLLLGNNHYDVAVNKNEKTNYCGNGANRVGGGGGGGGITTQGFIFNKAVGNSTGQGGDLLGNLGSPLGSLGLGSNFRLPEIVEEDMEGSVGKKSGFESGNKSSTSTTNTIHSGPGGGGGAINNAVVGVGSELIFVGPHLLVSHPDNNNLLAGRERERMGDNYLVDGDGDDVEQELLATDTGLL